MECIDTAHHRIAVTPLWEYSWIAAMKGSRQAVRWAGGIGLSVLALKAFEVLGQLSSVVSGAEFAIKLFMQRPIVGTVVIGSALLLMWFVRPYAASMWARLRWTLRSEAERRGVVIRSTKPYLEQLRRDVDARLRGHLMEGDFLPIPAVEERDQTDPERYVDPHEPERFTTPLQAFERFERRILLLGEAGSGKSTSLEFFTRMLCEAAEQKLKDAREDAPLPEGLFVPVRVSLPEVQAALDRSANPLSRILALGRPTTTRSLLVNAVLDGGLPGPRNMDALILEHLIEAGCVAWFFDSLDEVRPADAIPPLLEQIEEALLERAGNSPVVICSRSLQWQAVGPAMRHRLRLRSAVRLQPLTEQHAVEHLRRHGADDLAALVQSDTVLRDLASNPLCLRLIVLASLGKELTSIPFYAPAWQRRRELLNRFVVAAVEAKAETPGHLPAARGRAARAAFSLEEVYRYLGWVAQKMTRLGIIELDPPDPSWLGRLGRAPQAMVVQIVAAAAIIIAAVFGVQVVTGENVSALWMGAALAGACAGLACSSSAAIGKLRVRPAWLAPAVFGSLILVMGFAVLVAGVLADSLRDVISPRPSRLLALLVFFAFALQGTVHAGRQWRLAVIATVLAMLVLRRYVVTELLWIPILAALNAAILSRSDRPWLLALQYGSFLAAVLGAMQFIGEMKPAHYLLSFAFFATLWTEEAAYTPGRLYLLALCFSLVASLAALPTWGTPAAVLVAFVTFAFIGSLNLKGAAQRWPHMLLYRPFMHALLARQGLIPPDWNGFRLFCERASLLESPGGRLRFLHSEVRDHFATEAQRAACSNPDGSLAAAKVVRACEEGNAGPRLLEEALYHPLDEIRSAAIQAIRKAGNAADQERRNACSEAMVKMMEDHPRSGSAGDAFTFLEALHANEHAAGPNSLATGASAYMLARANHARNQLEQAAKLSSEAVSIFQTSLDKYAFPTGLAAGCLGNVRREQDRYSEAAELHQMAIDIFRNSSGAALSAAVATFELGSDRHRQGRTEEAERLLRQSLDQQRNLGVSAAESSPILNQLGLLYTDTGRLEEAERLLTQARESVLSVKGENHHWMAVADNNLALLYRKQGRLEEAEALFSQALEKMRKHLGDEHPRTLLTFARLASVCRLRGRVEEALTLLEHADRGRGQPHVRPLITAEIEFELGAALEAAGEHERAHTHFSQSLEVRLSVLGPDHPTTHMSVEAKTRSAELLRRSA